MVRKLDRISDGLEMPVEHQEQSEIALQLLGDEEVFFHVFVTVFSEFCGDFRMRQQKADLISRAFDGVCQQASVLVDDLPGYAANR